MQLLNKLKAMVSKNPAKITEGLEKVTSQIDKRTGGKYTDKLEKVTGTVEGQIEKLTTEGIDLSDSAAEAKEAAEETAAEAADAVEDKLGS